MPDYNHIPYTCPQCFADTIIKHCKTKGSVVKRKRECRGCKKEFWTLSAGKGETFDYWNVPGQHPGMIEYQQKKALYLRVKDALVRGEVPTKYQIALNNARQKLGIPKGAR